MTNDFGRMITAMVTPFNDDLTINFDQAKKLASYLVQTGSDGLVVAGTTGESPTLNTDEKVGLFKAIVEEVGGKAAVIAGTGSYSTADSIALTQAAQNAGVDGVMLVAPYYNKPPQEGLFQHFKAIAESTDLPIILYNIPGRTSVNMLPDTVARLAQISNIVAIKESSGSMDQVSELKRSLPDCVAIYSGDDSLTLPILALGGKGVISVASHLIGMRIKEMINAYHSGNTNLATKIHLELLPVFKGLFITTSPAPVKAALGIIGWQVGGLRLPLVEINAVEKESISSLLVNMKLS
ncbi:4-hydroxy-tetrahydrodipicolinate synthase [Pelotomaculum terephthalicicum JT]|uniref:4-hydroxy-tetrahydrodipicolinate synthase n=2 Tax=Pelotomaculum TaxID=191373 RepID=UPI0009CDD99E|nr:MULTISPECIES: 4-hydroxy-tetrahydrodipicolinate synthase [Pelotomaculum]MCG9967744.1 4-hydroxy-tetrahydrodipicolinate synthase [Pelotomaculum terephthalicicum JT]OPX85362.1 MAG: 4-hydroxy-tetrahydrodipicolinate synthase [Pelotomaculum sp. PtaB.Bin117]OPY62705.1 MAG: 4-hydroxy-tetrahydrodipicolinate synthase [Pelotomaculum sp. PtaU1.Bin065]